jgi:hypothetical protein
MEIIDKHYSDNVVSIEPVDHGPSMPVRVEGIEAVRAKNQAWMDNAENHGLRVDGPFVGEQQFAVRFHIDATPKATGRRVQVVEMALYTVEDSKIIAEEFYYAPV